MKTGETTALITLHARFEVMTLVRCVCLFLCKNA